MKTKIEETLEILSVVRLGAGPAAREKSQGFLHERRMDMEKKRAKKSAEKTNGKKRYVKSKEIHNFLKTTITMGEKEYRKTVAKLFESIEYAIYKTIEWDADQRDMMTDVLKKRFKETDKEIQDAAKLFKKIMKRQEEIAFCLYALIVKSMRQHGEIAGNDQKKDIAKLLGVDMKAYTKEIIKAKGATLEAIKL
jgi:hypothetical protein